MRTDDGCEVEALRQERGSLVENAATVYGLDVWEETYAGIVDGFKED